MLVLSRKAGQRVRIGDDVEVTVVTVEGGKVRLGFVAPRDVTIVRTELLEQERPPADEGKEPFHADPRDPRTR